jgi:proline dehydrogenase
MRKFFLYLSTHAGLRRWMETSPAAARLNQRFIAGLRLEDALAVVSELDGRGMQAALDHLGENVTTVAEANRAAGKALESLEAAAGLGVDASVSIKLTQFGLDLSRELTLGNVVPLVEKAGRVGSRVEVDMESSAYTEQTVAILHQLAGHGPVRAVIQAYLHRSEEDILEMNRRKIPVRLCKGAYNEPAAVAIQDKRGVDENFKKLADLLLDGGAYPAFATHDPAMIEHVLSRDPAPSGFEFQMLYGIRRDLQERLRGDRYRMRLYVPYGEAWYPYFMRRLAERPANVFFLLKNL